MKHAKFKILQCFSYVLLVSLSAFTCSGKAEQKTLVIGIEALDYLPFYQVRAGEPLSGYSVDLLRLFGRKSGYDIKFKAHNVSRLFSVFLAGRVDFKYPDSPNWSEQMKKSHGIYYSKSTTAIVDGILTLKKNEDLLLDEFKVLGSIKGFSPWPYMGWVQIDRITLVEADNMDQLFRLLKAGRIHGAYVNVLVGMNYAKQNLPNLDVVWNRGLPFGKDNYFLSTIYHKEVLEDFNAFLIKYKKEIDALKRQYGIEYIDLNNN
ncbi:substrate-binding periplasmic protein [Thalassomonas haliotis]|uniref:Transporter substrate-binding domain-containing protein n=1 Tax=Thalassomonas haliotis TaxID=485448 RepID=A0ABY7VD60_9GAMM|nr:transporter substrate-binding domain-containing protein [Thalassomonas haliotis]WDE11325.1 transporter substrate-binding domain-containing protein [Thalassomonas haliotis]